MLLSLSLSAYSSIDKSHRMILFNLFPVSFFFVLEYAFRYQTVPTLVYVRLWKSSLAYGFTRTTTIS